MASEAVDRRTWLKVVGGTIAGLIIGGAVGWLGGKPTEVTKTVLETITKTVTTTPAITTVTVPTTVPTVTTVTVPTTEIVTVTPVEAPHIVKAKEKAKLIDWNTPKMTDRIMGIGELVDIEKYSDYGVTLKGKGMVGGYTLPKGWEKAVEGVKRLVMTNSGSLKHDPATVLNAKIFEELTGIHLEIIEMKDALLWPKTLSVLTAKSKDVDMFYSTRAMLEIPQLSAAKWIVPIDELWPKEVHEFYPVQLLPSVKGIDGRFYGSPFCLWGLYLFYRPSWLKEAGVSVPKTWQELIVVSKKVDEWAKKNLGEGYAGMVYPANDLDVLHNLWGMTTYSQNKRIVIDGRPVIDKDAWKVMVDLWLRGGMSLASLEYFWVDAPEVFAKGRAGFVITGGVYMKMYQDPEFAGPIQGDWDVTFIPGWEGISERGAMPAGNDTWIINPYIEPEKVAASMLWLDYLRSYQAAFNELYVEGNESVVKAVYDHPEIKKTVMRTDLRVATVASQIAEFYPPGMMEVMEVFRTYLHKAVLGELDPETARSKAQAEIDQIV